MSDAPDRSGAERGHRHEHFDEAAQIARMGAVFRSRMSDRDDLTFGNEPPGDD